MKTSLCFLLAFVGAIAVRAEDQGFLSKLPSERFNAAGLGKLSPAELAELEKIFQEHRNGGESSGHAQEAAPQTPAAHAAASEPRGRDAAPAEAAGEKQPGWLAALITLKRVEDEPEKADVLESRIAGTFDGWSGNTVFTLVNGQKWVQAAKGSYIDRPIESPGVKIYPATFGAYWMEVEGLRQRVRVKPLKLE